MGFLGDPNPIHVQADEGRDILNQIEDPGLFPDGGGNGAWIQKLAYMDLGIRDGPPTRSAPY